MVACVALHAPRGHGCSPHQASKPRHFRLFDPEEEQKQRPACASKVSMQALSVTTTVEERSFGQLATPTNKQDRLQRNKRPALAKFGFAAKSNRGVQLPETRNALSHCVLAMCRFHSNALTADAARRHATHGPAMRCNTTRTSVVIASVTRFAQRCGEARYRSPSPDCPGAQPPWRYVSVRYYTSMPLHALH